MADLIEKNAAMRMLSDYAETQQDLDYYRDMLMNIPAVNRWISVEDALPEQGERVIVAIFGSDMIMPNEGETLQDAIERSRKEGYITVGFIGSDGWYGADWFPLMVHPSYWMPKPDLPEPPKE